jgi:hypothetical protein
LGNYLSIAFILLLISIGIVPALAILDGLVAQSVASVLAAIALAFVGISARAADVSFAAQVTRRLKLAATVPAIWMVIQILPMPFGSHSIWINANDALDQQSWGHISVDIGKTAETLAFYLGNVALIVVSVFATRDRRQAELTLSALTAITALTTIVLLIGKWGLIPGLGKSVLNEILGAISSLGIILSLTAGVCTFERNESRPTEPAPKAQNTQIALAARPAALLVCIVGLVTSATLNIGLVAAFGAIAFASVQAIRRVGLARWATGMFLTTMIIAAAMIILWRYDSVRALSPFLQFATAASSDAISVAQRLLSDTGWLGTGAGTYAPLLPIYQELGSSVTRAPSTASAFAIELGSPMALFTIAATIGLIVVLYRGALDRGRDSFYPAAAAACTIIILGQAFCDTSLLHSCVAVVGDAVIGLGLAQSVSHRDGP